MEHCPRAANSRQPRITNHRLWTTNCSCTTYWTQPSDNLYLTLRTKRYRTSSCGLLTTDHILRDMEHRLQTSDSELRLWMSPCSQSKRTHEDVRDYLYVNFSFLSQSSFLSLFHDILQWQTVNDNTILRCNLASARHWLNSVSQTTQYYSPPDSTRLFLIFYPLTLCFDIKLCNFKIVYCKDLTNREILGFISYSLIN